MSPSLVSSLTHGDNSKPLVDQTLTELLDLQARKYADRPCLVVPWTGVTWTYSRLQQESLALAHGLLLRGLRQGDRIAIIGGNCERYVAVFFACMRIGAILVVLNHMYTAHEATLAIDFTGSKLVFVTPTIGRADHSQLIDEALKAGSVAQIALLRGHYDGCKSSYIDILARTAPSTDMGLQQNDPECDSHSVCTLMFTSGSTGKPRAAMLTHHSLVNNARFVGQRIGLNPSDVLCCPPPLSHCFGLVLGMLTVVSHGASIVFPSHVFDPEACLRAISEQRCTALHGVPAMFTSIMAIPRPLGWQSHLRTGIVAGAPVPQNLMKAMAKDLRMHKFTSSYGLTEASPTCFNAMHNDPIGLKLTTVGHIMPHAHAKVVGKDGAILPIETRGELCIAGYQLQRGYWRDKTRTKECMRKDEDGCTWLHTGDEAVLHADGTCTITGRLKDLIIRGGENLSPLEIEERLLQHPAIDRAVVVGVKDTRYGEVVGCFIGLAASRGGLRPTYHDIQSFVRQSLAYHKAPEHIFWLGNNGIPKDIPLTASGKVKKYELKQLAKKLTTTKRIEPVAPSCSQTKFSMECSLLYPRTGCHQ